MCPRILAGLTLAAVSFTLVAGDVAPLVADLPETQTERWLQVQREGDATDPQRAQTATLSERELSMQRLLDSYNYPIPEYFGEDDGGSFER